MVNLDADADPGTFNSSSAEVAAPAQADVLWAGLYWGASPREPADRRAGRGDGGPHHAVTDPCRRVLDSDLTGHFRSDQR